jgi:hypothetical protein
MQLSNPKQVANLDEFLPSDGETRFEIFFANGSLSLDVFYEAEDQASREAKRRIRFDKAKYFFKTPFPGYSFFICPDDRNLSLLNSLVEYEESELLDIERSSSGTTDYKHYRLFLHSTGAAIHVIAQSFDVSTEELCGGI